MKLTKVLLALLVFSFILFSGCSPDDLELAIKASSIEKAVSGSCGMATATVVFETSSDDIKSKFSRIRDVVMPYLGKDGKITFLGNKIRAKFKVPVASSSYMGSFSEVPLAKLELDGNKLQFKPTAQLSSLNRELRRIDAMIDIDFKAKHVVFKIIGDNEAKCGVKATAVFVDGEAKLNYQAVAEDDESVDIEFRCGDASIYSQIQPFVEIVK